MTLKIGNRLSPRRCFFSSPKAFTFVEVMVTISILSFGLVMIYSSLLASLDRMDYLTHRLYAHHVLENRIASVERILRSYKALPFELDQKEIINVDNKEMALNLETMINQVDNFLDTFELNVSVNWTQHNREIHLRRSAYISDFELSSQ